MKDLGKDKRILCIEIERDRLNSTLFLYQSPYISKVLKRFSMNDCKLVTLPLANHFVLSKDQALRNEQEIEYMSGILYSKVIGSIMHLIVCTRSDLAFATSTLSRYMSNF